MGNSHRKRGQSVDAVAKKHGMTASYLRATNGPFKERKGKFTQPATFMAPNAKDAQAISMAFDRKVLLKREQQTMAGIAALGNQGDDAPIQKSASPRELRENLRLATISLPSAVSTNASAIATETTTTNKTATQYVVKPGDTLFSIAKQAGISLTALKAVNQLTSNTVNIGQTLQVAGATSEFPPALALVTTASVAEAKTSLMKTTQTPQARQVQKHTVRAGDTLFSIAKRFNTSVVNLLDGCGISLPNHQAGQLPSGLMLWQHWRLRCSNFAVCSVGRDGAELQLRHVIYYQYNSTLRTFYAG
ncbi:MAG: LysM peptidoglycan-binding domain-containing protein [Gammaproteobacteria bacterium]|nr:LysM peptidoglycan-binding domain-containing protein [Gammaproteobacteria bacterium]